MLALVSHEQPRSLRSSTERGSVPARLQPGERGWKPPPVWAVKLANVILGHKTLSSLYRVAPEAWRRHRSEAYQLLAAEIHTFAWHFGQDALSRGVLAILGSSAELRVMAQYLRAHAAKGEAPDARLAAEAKGHDAAADLAEQRAWERCRREAEALAARERAEPEGLDDFATPGAAPPPGPANPPPARGSPTPPGPPTDCGRVGSEAPPGSLSEGGPNVATAPPPKAPC